MRSFPFRVLIFGGVACVAAAGVWTFPAADGARPTSAGASSQEAVVAPVVDLPDVSVAREVAPAQLPTTSASVVAVTTEPDHLATAEAVADPDPAAVVTTATTTTPSATTTAAPVETVAFTATQAYGSSTTTADGNGHWEKKVEFPSAPRGETFAVAASGLGGSAALDFSATGEAV